MKTPNTKIQAPKKSQFPNSNSSSDVGGLELEHWSFSGVWSLVFDVWLVGRGIWCFVNWSIVNQKWQL
jgi:hypothetical protein